MNKGILIGIGILLAVVVVGVFVLPGGYKAPTPTTEVPKVQPTPSPAVGEGAREIVVNGDEYSFSPKMIELVAGETVKITFKNMGKLPHNLVITELGVSTKTIPGGQTDSVTVTADKSGMYSFFCSVSNHRQLGMEGSLEIK